MKRIATAVLVFALSAGATAFAAEQKNECLLTSKSCSNEVDTLQQRIKKLDTEIQKGKKVYSPEELKVLKQKLQDVKDYLDILEKPQGK